MSVTGPCPVHGAAQLSVARVGADDMVHVRSWLVCARVAEDIAGELGTPRAETLAGIGVHDAADAVMRQGSIDIGTTDHGAGGETG